MAKGEAVGRYQPQGITSAEDLIPYLMQELGAIADALDVGLARNVEFLHVEPAKPREGLIVGADGTDWNPGGGKGVYAYYSAAWNKLG